MVSDHLNIPLVVIVGPTASGKTGLAIDLAVKYGGEVICADSRTIYKDMDVGTAKPTPAEQELVPHWGLDLVEPGEYFSVAEFKSYADQKILEIRSRGHIPFLVGGTGLYIDAVLFDYSFGPPANASLRRKLESYTLDQLYEYCEEHSVVLPENSTNKRYIIRTIERRGIVASGRDRPIDNSIVVGIATGKAILRQNIADRTEQLFNNGVVKEATILGRKYGWTSEAMTANIYRLIRLYLENEITLAEAKIRFTALDWRLAKRQLTWLRRNKYIYWLNLVDARNYLMQTLANSMRA